MADSRSNAQKIQANLGLLLCQKVRKFLMTNRETRQKDKEASLKDLPLNKTGTI